MKKQTAVEWLYNQMDVSYAPDKVKQWFEQAKEMEKEQIIDAAKYGNSFEQGDLISEIYYNKTYGK